MSRQPTSKNNSLPILTDDLSTYTFCNNTTKANITKRALRTGSTSSSSRTIGLGMKSSKSQPSSRRKNKQTNSNDIRLDRKKSCHPFPEDNVASTEIIKYGPDASLPYSSGTIIKITCEKGYGLNLPNTTVKCIRGKWRPTRPKCLICKCFCAIHFVLM